MSPSQSYMMLGFLLLVDLPLLKAPLVMKKFSPIASKHDAAVSLIFFFFLPSLGFLSFFGLSFFPLSYPSCSSYLSSFCLQHHVSHRQRCRCPWLIGPALTSGSADTAAWCSPNMPPC